MNCAIFLRPGKRKFTSLELVVVWVLIYFVNMSGCQDFRIDNQLRIQTNDCYTRIAIGSRMPDSAVISTTPVNSLSDCEASCSGNRTVCNAFSFGIDARGNGTCRIGRMNVNARGNDLIMDSDWDVYERRPKMPRGCQHDRLLRIGFGARQSVTNSSNGNETAALGRQFNPQANVSSTMMMTTTRATTRRPQNPFGNPFAGERLPVGDPPREPSFFRGGWYAPFADDGDARLYDIINNKKNSKSNRWQQTVQREKFPGEHHEVGIHEVEGYEDDLYGTMPFGGFGSDDKWNSGLHETNSQLAESIPGSNPKWIHPGPGFNPQWSRDVPGSNVKWIGAIPELNVKWQQEVSNSNPKWNEDVPGSNPAWNQDVQDSNTKWGERIPGSKSKWNQDVPGSNPQWTEAITGSKSNGNKGFEAMRSKWNVGFSKLDGAQRGISHSTSTIAPPAATLRHFSQTAGLGSHGGINFDPVLEKTKGR